MEVSGEGLQRAFVQPLFPAGWGRVVPWKRRATGELKTSADIHGTWRMPDWSGSVKK